MTYTAITFPARVILSLLPDRNELLGAEVGVHRGKTAATLLARRPTLRLYMVDHWGLDGEEMEGARGHSIMDEAMAETSFADDRRIVLAIDSLSAAEEVADGSLDFAHVDADHRYPAVLHDIRAWWPKVKAGGFLCGHDFDNHPPEFGPWDVRRAVEEFTAEAGLEFEVYRPETEWVIRKP